MARWSLLAAGTVFLMSMMTSQVAFADIQTLIMPGDLVQSHAELESDCSNCHKAFKKSLQNGLCLTCHEDVAADFTELAGFHGKSTQLKDQNCSDCHTDHTGRNAKIVLLDESSFDHKFTDYLLSGKHKEADCDGCHKPADKHREAPQECFACHRDDDNHEGKLGENCGQCHNESDWLDISFDHNTTDYPLVGKHEAAQCADCHKENVFKGAPDDCFSCHEKDDVHKGLSGNNCGNCHNPNGWDDTSFDHQRDTHFPLDGKHALLSCDGCHSAEPFSDKLEMQCNACHAEDDHHDGHLGDECEQCHVTSDWTDSTFDHDIDTDYLLKGAHRSLECVDCHEEPVFAVKLQTACIDCHKTDDPHEGVLGTDCVNCHNEVSWADDVRFDHDLTRFPILGKHLELECTECHETKAFKHAETECVSCHADDDPHQRRFSGTCEGCHNPVDWNIWFFDHDVQTDFGLDGAHVKVACNDCHRQPIDVMKTMSTRCGDCHKADDVHDGEFGSNCERCHSSESFKDVRSLQ